MVAISTAWNARRHDTADGILREIADAGFANVELNVQLSAQMVGNAERLLPPYELHVTSLHNYCPVPDGYERLRGSGGLFPYSSDAAAVRDQAVRWTDNTIEAAARLGARMVVGHWGRVELPGAAEAQYEATEAMRFGAIRPEKLTEWVERREAVARPFVERALDSFSRVVPFARENGIRLGVENRNFFFEIPSLDEIGEFLALAPDVAGYWHDMGHAEILEWLGVERPHAFREQWAERAIAVHVHDVKHGQDHLAMGQGDMDFASELAAFPKGIPWIIESHHGTLGEIRRMREALQALSNG